MNCTQCGFPKQTFQSGGEYACDKCGNTYYIPPKWVDGAASPEHDEFVRGLGDSNTKIIPVEDPDPMPRNESLPEDEDEDVKSSLEDLGTFHGRTRRD